MNPRDIAGERRKKKQKQKNPTQSLALAIWANQDSSMRSWQLILELSGGQWRRQLSLITQTVRWTGNHYGVPGWPTLNCEVVSKGWQLNLMTHAVRWTGNHYGVPGWPTLNCEVVSEGDSWALSPKLSGGQVITMAYLDDLHWTEVVSEGWQLSLMTQTVRWTGNRYGIPGWPTLNCEVVSEGDSWALWPKLSGGQVNTMAYLDDLHWTVRWSVKGDSWTSWPMLSGGQVNITYLELWGGQWRVTGEPPDPYCQVDR